MKLRKRSQNSTDSDKPEPKKKKFSVVRRSERIKTEEKPSENDPSTSAKKDNKKVIKKKVPLKSKKKKPNEDDADNTDYESLFPQVVDTGIKDIIDQIKDNNNDEVIEEASVIFECRECKSFFRVLNTFIRHKQSYCLTLADRKKSIGMDCWTPFMIKELFDLFPSSDESSDSASDDDSAFEDGPSASPKVSK